MKQSQEDDQKNALAREAEEAERLANENRRQAEERERYNAACELAICWNLVFETRTEG
jgi:hypothetical protein